MADELIDIIHVTGCGDVAFRVTERPYPFSEIRAETARLLDGSSPRPHDPISCGTCGNPIWPTLEEQLVPDGGWAK